MKEGTLKTFIVVLVILALGWILAGPIAFIGPGERGVVVNKGKVTGQVHKEGWHLFNSFTKDIVQFDVRSQVDVEEIAAASKDLQDVNVEVAVQYRLDEDSVAEIFETIGDQKAVVSKIINPAVQETVKASSATFPVADVIRERSSFKEKVESLLTERLVAYGIVLEEISIKNITFSDEFTQAVEDKQVAEQKKAQAKFEAEAQVETSTGKAEAQRIEGEAIRLNPEILKLREIEQWDGAYPKTIVAGDSGTLLQIPGTGN